ncbi:MAG: diguanylate cyclase, partial [Myxococcota bacterium]|nr:diguanylate cyclase [Myxococcota bacterium]
DFTTRVALKDRDEFGQLAETFNAMAEELESYTSDLEKRVAERTAEVETKNRQLEAVNRQLEAAVDELDRLARTDALTGMFNRRAFEERLNFEVRRSQRSKYALSLLIVDLDLFKSVNDTYGHPSGDLVLQRLSGLLETNLRTTDLLARLGGEEFAILLIDTASEDALLVAEKLRKAVEDTRFEDVQGQHITGVTISAGLASFPNHAEDVDTLCQRADSALYMAKNNGRNRVDVWRPELSAAANDPSSG